VRLALRGGNVVEWLALRAGLVPRPAAEAWGGMALAGVLVAAVELGLTVRLAAGPATAAELSTELGLDPTATRLLLECLRSARYVIRRGPVYRLSRTGRRWLDPAAGGSVARFVEANADYWSWWARLPEVARTGRPVDQHAAAPDDPYWRRYLYGQRDLARLTAGEVARRVRVPAGARSLLDVGGGHGWYAAELCRRHPDLTATVLDLPGSAAIGREIIAEAGLAARVHHRDGDALDPATYATGLDGPYDMVSCFNLVHHLTPDQIAALLRRIHQALAPGGTLAVMDAFAEPGRRSSAPANLLGLFVYLTSGSKVHTPAQLHEWLREAGFGAPRRIPVLRIPGQALYVVTKDDGGPRR